MYQNVKKSGLLSKIVNDNVPHFFKKTKLSKRQTISGEVCYCMLTHPYTCKIASCEKLHVEIKLFDYTFFQLNFVFDQDICLLLCYYYTDYCKLLLTRSCINKYFDSESYLFYTEVKKVFSSVQFTTI